MVVEENTRRTLALWYSVSEALDVIIDAILDKDYRLFAGKLSNEDTKVHACAGDRSMKITVVESIS